MTMQRTASGVATGKPGLCVRLFLPWVFGTLFAAIIGWVTVVWIVFTSAASTWDRSDKAHRAALWGGMGILYGTLIGIAQWVVLRNRLRYGYRWIVATALGECVYWILAFAPDANLTSMGRGSLIGACGGLALGASQWTVIRRDLRYAWAWVVATVVGSVLGEVATQFIPATGHPSVLYEIGPILSTAVTALTTALLAVKLFSLQRQ